MIIDVAADNSVVYFDRNSIKAMSYCGNWGIASKRKKNKPVV